MTSPEQVEFIDTPGLTDGTLKYPFPIEDAICEVMYSFIRPIVGALPPQCIDSQAQKHKKIHASCDLDPQAQKHANYPCLIRAKVYPRPNTRDHFFHAKPSFFPHTARGPRKPHSRLSRPDRQGTGRADDEAGPEAFSGDDIVYSSVQDLGILVRDLTISL